MFRDKTTRGSLLVVLALLGGCQSSSRSEPDAQVSLKLDPSPPVVGTNAISISLTTADGQPVEGADVSVEGNMNHAGMKPSFADVTEVEPGRYAGTLDFTMGGDWFVLVKATTADGEQIERKIDVPGVKAP